MNNIDFNQKRDRGLTGKFITSLYGLNKFKSRKIAEKLMWRLLGNHHQFYSETLRKIFKKYHNIDVGMYSHGGAFNPNSIPPDTKIGKYCSIAVTATIFQANHPVNTKSTHAFFFNPDLGYCENLIIPVTNLEIGNDVWIGHNAVILPSCTSIGDGAVIGAGAVVNKDIPPYGIAIGNPARVVMYRFSQEKIDEIKASKWWDKPIEVLMEELDNFQIPIGGDQIK